MMPSFWESEAPEAEGSELESQPQAEIQPVPPSPEPVAPPEALTLSADDFSALEDRVMKAVELVKRERAARTEAEERAAQAEADLRDQAPQIDRLQSEITSLQEERDQIRQRIEKLLAKLDTLEL
jgi:septal ring factor EnvC (AmiA/AmiB activator)